MKKFTVLMLAALLVVAFTVPASAVENIFGGYWRTRFFQQRNFEGDNGTEAKDIVAVDTRTRLFYTAKLNDNLKLVTAFEMDSAWGTAPNAPGVTGPTAIGTTGKVPGGSYGRTGTDANAIEIKHLYADFNVGPVNMIVGAQPFKLARGFISDEDGVGMKAIWKVNEGLYLPFIWQKMYDGNDGYPDPAGKADGTRLDIDMYIFTPIIMLSKDIKINPYYVFAHSQDGTLFSTVAPAFGVGTFNNINIHMAGIDFDGKFGAASAWFTGIMQFGSADLAATGVEVDAGGYLVAAGGKFDLGKADIHGQIFYASGDDDGVTDKKIDAFIVTASNYYYWAEILGHGIFDEQVPTGSIGYRSSNILAANVGATFKPMDKLKISADLWYAKLAEDNTFGEDKLGLETDVVVSYQLVEGLTLDVVGAYLFAGDAVSADGKNNTDPYEFGTRLSLSF